MHLLGRILAAISAVIAAIQTIARATETRQPAIASTPHQPYRITWSPPDGWICMACKRQRPDQAIGVTHVPVQGWEAQFPQMRLNYRHCTDSPECVAKALQLRDAGGASPS